MTKTLHRPLSLRAFTALAVVLGALLFVAGLVAGRALCPRCVAASRGGRFPVVREVAHGALFVTCEGE